MLFPQRNFYRTIHDLNGFWRFQADPSDAGEREQWFLHPLPVSALVIAVPGAWNEQLAERGLMNYVGSGWYETEFSLPGFDAGSHRAILRLGAAQHRAQVWLNGACVGGHVGGYLPFEIDLTEVLAPAGAPNRLTIQVDSRLTMETLPQGMDPDAAPYNSAAYDRRHVYPPTRFDFFPYGGLTRSVQILVVSALRVKTLAIRADLWGTVTLRAGVTRDRAKGVVRIFNPDRSPATAPQTIEIAKGELRAVSNISTPLLWSPAHPVLYSAEVTLLDERGKTCDCYSQEFGFREIRVETGQLLLNGTPLYLVGFGKHEDLPVIGQAHSRPVALRDFELMKWAGANSFRTSHYPYDEEVMQLADRFGFLVIDEVPAVSLGFPSDNFQDLVPLLDHHRGILTELIERDRNHPSVIAWSIVNEPNLWSEPHYQNEASRRYFRELYDHVRALDPERPVLAVAMAEFSVGDVVLEACDIIGINRYFGWYTNPADLGKARMMLEAEMDGMYSRYGKPIVITECGVDTLQGLHATTPQMFTEEYQVEFLRTYASVADRKSYCAGFHVWNFSDFLTPQNFRRVGSNRKGVFTRSREPKGAAFFLRSHWTTLQRVANDHRPARHCDEGLIPDRTNSR